MFVEVSFKDYINLPGKEEVGFFGSVFKRDGNGVVVGRKSHDPFNEGRSWRYYRISPPLAPEGR